MLSKIDPNRDMREDSVILKDGNEIDIAWDLSLIHISEPTRPY